MLKFFKAVKNFLILKYNNCQSGGVCQVPYSLSEVEDQNKFTFTWQTENDFYTTFNIVLYKIDENGQVISTVFNQNVPVKSYDVLKSFLGGGIYRFAVRTICGNSFSGFHSVEFEFVKIGVGLEQNLIG